MRRLIFGIGLALAACPGIPAADPIQVLAAPNPDPVAAREAVDALVGRGPAALPDLVAAVPAGDVVAANWLRAAFDRIMATELKNGGGRIPADALARFAKDPSRPGRARRLALDAVEAVRPGTTDGLLPGWLDDPEFGPDAVDALLERTTRATPDAARDLLERGFQATRDPAQSLAVAARLKAAGAAPDVLGHLGVVKAWRLVGPFDDPAEKGFATPFPPESKIDLAATYPGKSGEVRWAAVTPETPDGRIDLRKQLADVEGAVAYGYAVVRVDAKGPVWVLAGADDNIAVWVNGDKVMAHGHYHGHLRPDWYKADATLKAGDNAVLVKVCQRPAPREKAPGPPNKWEFLVRFVDPTGKGVAFTSGLPE